MASERRPRAELQSERKACGLVHSEYIPAPLLRHRQWVCWRYVDRGAGRKLDKQPVNPCNLANAGVHWANTWTTFDEAYATYRQHAHQGVHGIGFVLTPSDPYVAVDLDACVDEEAIDSTAAQIITDLASYTELSPSGRGFHILLACPAFHGNARRASIEVYSHSRYVTMTGHHLPGAPPTIAAVSPDVIASLVPPVRQHATSAQTHVPRPELHAANDSGLWEHIFAHDKYGHQHRQRFRGDSSLDRGDHSFTVIRLLNCLARWTHCHAGRMRSMMLLSPLANEKWFEKRGDGDWLDYQIADAIAYVNRSVKK